MRVENGRAEAAVVVVVVVGGLGTIVYDSNSISVNFEKTFFLRNETPVVSKRRKR